MLSERATEEDIAASVNGTGDVVRSRLEAAFREQRFRAMIDALPAAIYTTDAEGRLTHFNPAAVEFSGRVPALGSDQWCVSWKLYYPDGRPMPHDECPMAIALKEGRIVRGAEAIAERPDGKRIWFVPYPSPLRDDEGNIVGGINMLVDVTEKKWAEQQLRQRERELADFFENATVAMHWVGPDGIILRVNQAELDLLGYSRDEYVGHHIADFHADQDVIDDILRRLCVAEELHGYEARLRCKDGSLRHVLISSNVRWENGEFIHTRCITHDVTERKLAEAALREREARYRALVEATTHVVWTANAVGEFDTEQPDWAAYTGQTFEEYRGFGWAEALHPDTRARSESLWMSALNSGTLYENECRIRRHDGEYRWFAVRAAPVRDESGAIREWIGTDTDITDRKLAEAALRRLNESLEAQVAERTAALAESEAQIRRLATTLTMAEQEERRRIAQVLHDDLQQQLYGVQMKLKFARHEVEAGDTDGALRSIADAEVWLGEGIHSSRQLTVDLSPPILKSEGLADMLGWLITQMREMHSLSVTLEAEHPFCIADEDMRVLLFQSVRELLFNVVKHAAANRATVELLDGDGCLVIRVTDDGRGFDVRRAGQEEGEGGFGLFSVRERLGLLGGHTEIESAPGEGTRVTLSVPLDGER